MARCTSATRPVAAISVGRTCGNPRQPEAVATRIASMISSMLEAEHAPNRRDSSNPAPRLRRLRLNVGSCNSGRTVSSRRSVPEEWAKCGWRAGTTACIRAKSPSRRCCRISAAEHCVNGFCVKPRSWELAHPNIARLLDAGSAPDGSVYLVLEYVRGICIDTWCDEQKLTSRSATPPVSRCVCGRCAGACQSRSTS